MAAVRGISKTKMWLGVGDDGVHTAGKGTRSARGRAHDARMLEGFQEGGISVRVVLRDDAHKAIRAWYDDETPEHKAARHAAEHAWLNARREERKRRGCAVEFSALPTDRQPPPEPSIVDDWGWA